MKNKHLSAIEAQLHAKARSAHEDRAVGAEFAAGFEAGASERGGGFGHRVDEVRETQPLQGDPPGQAADHARALRALGETRDPGAILAGEHVVLKKETGIADWGRNEESEMEVAQCEAALMQFDALAGALEKGEPYYRRSVEACEWRDETGLPRDDVRQFFRGHNAWLLNQDSAWLSADEKAVLRERRTNLAIAEKSYIAMQREALGMAPKEHEQDRGRER